VPSDAEPSSAQAAASTRTAATMAGVTRRKCTGGP
jgi:hypothetical protein